MRNISKSRLGLDEKENLFLTEEEKECFKSVAKKRRKLLERRDEIEGPYEKLEGSVFDGGFGWVVRTDEMTKSEREEYEAIQNELEFINDCWGE